MTVHYSAHIGIAPSFKLTGLQFFHSPEVSLLQICFIALCNCYTFCQIYLAPYLCFNVVFQHFLTFTHLKKSRYLMANLPSGSTYPHVLYANQYSVFKVHSAYALFNETKGNSLTYSYATSKSNIFVISFVSNLQRNVSSTQ